MENLIKTAFNTNDLNNWQKMIAEYLPIILTIIIAIIVIKHIMNVVKKLVTKSKIPKNAHVFVISTIRIVLYFILVMRGKYEEDHSDRRRHGRPCYAQSGASPRAQKNGL